MFYIKKFVLSIVTPILSLMNAEELSKVILNAPDFILFSNID